jgi:hypothetical protein
VEESDVEEKRSQVVPRKKQLLLLLAVVVVVGGGYWLIEYIKKPNAAQCLDRAAGGFETRPRERARALKAVETGTLNVEGDSDEARSMRSYLTHRSLLTAIAECRRIHYLDADEPVGPVNSGATIEITGTTRVHAEYRNPRAPDFAHPATGVRVYSDNPKVGTCDTDEKGVCNIPFERLKTSDTVRILSDPYGQEVEGAPTQTPALDFIQGGKMLLISERRPRFRR